MKSEIVPSVMLEEACWHSESGIERFFPHIGMPTPNIIDRRSAQYLDQLVCGYVEHLTSPATTRLGMSAHSLYQWIKHYRVSETDRKVFRGSAIRGSATQSRI